MRDDAEIEAMREDWERFKARWRPWLLPLGALITLAALALAIVAWAEWPETVVERVPPPIGDE